MHKFRLHMAAVLAVGLFAPISAMGGKIQGSYMPLSSGPIGKPVAPRANEFDLDQFNAILLEAMAELDNPASDKIASARVVREVIQERDARLANANPPKRTVATR